MTELLYDRGSEMVPMDERSLTVPVVRTLGLLGAAMLAYSAGYTRAFVVATGVRITPEKEIISLGGLPVWTGLLGFAGMGLLFLFLLGSALEYDVSTFR